MLALLVAPTFVSAALFPKDTVVKQIGPKEFRKVMKQNTTSAVAFVAPWCGHCQRMAPEYSKAALGLYPLVPFYAVDCDAQANKKLCAEQGVKGFPTVKLFPRGGKAPPMEFDGQERTASAFFYWVSRRIPHSVKKLYNVDDIPGWKNTDVDKPRALLLTKDKKIPLLWQVLSVKYGKDILFASHRDRKGKSSVSMGLEAGERDQAKVLIYPPGQTEYVRFEGILKLDSLSKFFDSVLDGTADLTIANKEAAAEEYVVSDEELEIQRKQEAQRIALAHGGFSDLIDFEKAVLNGAGADFHSTNGYAGVMGGQYLKKKDGEPESSEEKAAKKQEEKARPKTPDAGAAKATETAEADPSVVADAPEPAAESAAEPQVVEEKATGEPAAPEAESTPTTESHVKDEL
ncbi:hypothetical protein PUNSTDRAFT_77492 [Punctularia strigosozonata HHB-11173 SS5]|uniref:Thioredoxin domain-containing protein n=1 Tax=Punctularia strigosozonata (strain HHB-11173) TaxID=741275 RepID=R7S0A9_PUNST|nr:uncharacterized protein PUNSTDRAFT_77492 [Punctularia strigosozonata HHB-11173 SS5]EIN03815.1 hypothetical protein PUNSTDRAFT_77492 [Punctularia strigosozonata HHB-11173 SS5]